VATQGGPRRLTGQPFQQTVGVVLEGGNHPWAGELFGGEVEGVDVAGGWGRAGQPILLLTLQGSGGPRGGVAGQYPLKELSVAVRARRLSGWITACGFPSRTTET
jgi:hypothetical protein